jgi:ferredoxin
VLILSAAAVLVIIAALVSRNMRRRSEDERIKNPRGLQNVGEWAVEYLINLLEGAAGKHYRLQRPHRTTGGDRLGGGCNGCGDCEPVCPVIKPNPFEMGIRA